MKKILLPLAAICMMNVAVAEEEEYGYSGSASFGASFSSGNSDTQNINLDAFIQNNTEQFRHNYFANYLQSENDNVTSADRFLVGYKLDWKLTDYSYVWGEIRYEQDDFSSYDNQITGSTGYGRHVINNDVQTLDLEGGIGFRSSELISGETQDEVVFRGALFYAYNISETASFHQDVIVLAGSDNTSIDSKTALRAKIAGNISAEAAYILKHNTDVLPGTDKTDSLTALSVVYGF